MDGPLLQLYHMKVHMVSYNLGKKKILKSKIHILPIYGQTDSKTAIVWQRTLHELQRSIASLLQSFLCFVSLQHVTNTWELTNVTIALQIYFYSLKRTYYRENGSNRGPELVWLEQICWHHEFFWPILFSKDFRILWPWLFHWSYVLFHCPGVRVKPCINSICKLSNITSVVLSLFFSLFDIPKK